MFMDKVDGGGIYDFINSIANANATILRKYLKTSFFGLKVMLTV